MFFQLSDQVFGKTLIFMNFITLALSFIFSFCVQAQAYEVISVPDNNEVLRLSSGFEVAIDKQGLLTIDDVINGSLTFKDTQLPLGGGYTRNTHWFRFTLQQKETVPTTWLLIAGPNYIDRLELYSPSNGHSNYTMMAVGDTIAASQLPLNLQYSSHTFMIILSDNQPHTFYLKMQTHSTSALHLSLASPISFNQYNNLHLLYSGFMLAVFVLLIIHASTVWAWLREATYLLIIGYAIGATLHRIAIDGLVAQYLLPNSPTIVNMFAPLGTFFLVSCFLAFFIVFYNTKQRHHRLHYLFISIIFFAVATLLSIPFDYYVTLAPYLLMASLFLSPIMLYVSWQGVKSNLDGSKSVLVGYIIYLILVTINILNGTGIIPSHPIALEMPQTASLIFLFSMHQGMAKQVNKFKIEKLTAEIKANDALIKAEDEKQRRLEQSTFMTMIAHELHTPLSVIDSAIQTIEMTNPELGTLISERHHRIQHSVNHLNKLLENTLAAESNEFRPLQPEIELIQAESFMRNVLQASLSDANRCQLTLTADCTICADHTLLQHIVSNLLVNAEKYTPTGSTFLLIVEKQERNNQVGTLISIQNIHTAEKKPDPSRWMKKYYRQTDTQNIKGFGLGLYLVQKIIEAHQGIITINISQNQPEWLITITAWLPDTDIKDDIL
tara:strand:- start:1031 stop:3028 length:1998 start_codon:yes stop_codon:yes gene_type:complete